MTTNANYIATLNRGTAGYYTAQNASAFNQLSPTNSFAAFCAFILKGSYQQLTPPLASTPAQWLWGNLDTINLRGWGLSIASTSTGMGLLAQVYDNTGVLATAAFAPMGNLFERLTMLGLWFDGTNILLSINGAIVATATMVTPGYRVSALPARLLAEPMAAATSSQFVDVVSAGYTPIDLGGTAGTTAGTAGRLVGTSFKAFYEGLGGATFVDGDAGIDWLHRYTPESVAGALVPTVVKGLAGSFVTAPALAPAMLPDSGNGGPVSAGPGTAVPLLRSGAPTISSCKNASVFFTAPSAAPGSMPTPPAGVTVVDLYVSSVLGNDANLGTITAPLATLDRAEQLIPDPVAVNYNIHLRNETYPLPSNTRSGWFRARTVRGGLVKIFSDEAWDATVYTNVLTAAAQAGTGAAVVVGVGLVVNAHRGLTIRMTTGAAAGQFRRINSNTATNILPSAPFSPVPAPGDTFQIFALAATIAVPAPTAGVAGAYTLVDSLLAVGAPASGAFFAAGATPTMNGVMFQGVRITATATYTAGDGTTWLYGVDQITQRLRKTSGGLFCGITTNVSAIAALTGWGLRCTNGQAELTPHARFQGYYHGDVGFLVVQDQAFADVIGGFAVRSFNTLSGSSRVGLQGSATTPFQFEAVGAVITLSVPTAYLRLFNATLAGVGGSGGGIVLQAGSVCQLENSVTGAAAAGSSVVVSGSSKIICTGGAPAFGGAGADWVVQGAAAFNKAALAALNSAVVGTDGSVATRAT